MIQSIDYVSTNALARNTDPNTSKDAAALVQPHVQDLQTRVYDVIEMGGTTGRTTSEIADRLAIARDSISPRIPVLRKLGLVVDSGRVRKAEGRRSQTVWIAAKAI